MLEHEIRREILDFELNARNCRQLGMEAEAYIWASAATRLECAISRSQLRFEAKQQRAIKNAAENKLASSPGLLPTAREMARATDATSCSYQTARAMLDG